MSTLENQKTTDLADLTEAETARVAGGDKGKHIGQTAKELGEPAWSLNPGKAEDAPGHLK